jgi:hypothetical protein
MATQPAGLPIADLREAGLLWLINRVVFHPRGYALALVTDEAGEAVGWLLQGDGSEPWTFAGAPDERGVDEDGMFRAAEATFAAATRAAMEHG